MDSPATVTAIHIIPASPDDAEGMQEVLYRAWLVTYPNTEFGITAEDIEDRFKDRFLPERLARRREQLSTPHPGTATLVAKEDGRVVGLCHVVIHADKNQLQSIYVLPGYQGRGIGGAFWAEVQKYLDPVKDTIVEVATYNTNAIKFYLRRGFVDTGKRWSDERFRMKSGAVIPELEMLKKADPASS